MAKITKVKQNKKGKKNQLLYKISKSYNRSHFYKAKIYSDGQQMQNRNLKSAVVLAYAKN